MYKFLASCLFVVSALFAHAQDFPIGKTKSEIRKTFKKNSFVLKTQGDSLDSYSLGNEQVLFYYRMNKCYMEKQVMPLMDKEAILKAFDKNYKKIKPNVWMDRLNNEIAIDENKHLNEFTIVVSATVIKR